jgi:hypothetical protein
MSVANIINVKFDYLTAWSVIKRRKENYKLIFKGERMTKIQKKNLFCNC